MTSTSDPLLSVVDFLNIKYGCGYRPDDFLGYFIKPISETEIPFIQGRTSNQYHIAVTAPDKGMRLFPFLASSNYISGDLNTDDKGRYSLALKFNLNRQNLIENIGHILSKIDTAKRDWKAHNYSTWLNELKKTQSPRFLPGGSTGTIAVRKGRETVKQLQLEIGKSNDPETFLLLRRCMEDGGRIIFLLRKSMDYDLYYFPPSAIPDGQFQDLYLKSFKHSISMLWEQSEQEGSTSALPCEIPENDALLVTTKRLLGAGYSGVIFSGPPGTSKSWYAYQIAAKLCEGDASRVRFVQFHQSYQYEDFVVGFLPKDDGSGFELKERHLLEMNSTARRNPNKPCFIVLDELSRADPGRVFGEALTYIEMSKRGIPFMLASGKLVTLEKNLFFLCTMNPWDKGVSEVDVAFERRFASISLNPDEHKLKDRLTKNGMEASLIERLVKFFVDINKSKNEYCRVGHAYFYGVKDALTLEDLWNYQLRALLRKAHRDTPDDFSEIEKKWKQVLPASE